MELMDISLQNKYLCKMNGVKGFILTPFCINFNQILM